MKSLRKGWLIILVLLIAAFVRFHGLTKEDVWLDEAFAIYHSQFSFNHIINLDDNHPPLYALILSISIKIFGISEFSARLPSVIFGVLSVLLIYFYGKYTFNKKIGITAAIILSLSSYHIFYSQEARMYSLLGFLSLASLYYYVRFRDSQNMTNSIFYLVTSILLVYTHYFGFFVIITQNIHYLLLSPNKKRKGWAFLQSIIFLSYLPWIYNFISRILAIHNEFWITKSYLLLVFLYPFIYAGGIILGVIYLSLLVYSIRYYLKNIKKIDNSERSQIKLLLMVISVPIILAVIYSIIINPILSHQYVIYSSLGMIVMMAYGVNKIKKPYKELVMLTLVVSSVMYVYIQNQDQIKYRWKESGDYARSIVGSNDVIVIFPGHHMFPFLFYFDNCFYSLEINKCVHQENLTIVYSNHSQLLELSNESNNIILIETTPNTLKEIDFTKILNGKYELVSTKSFKSSQQIAEFSLIDYFIRRFGIGIANNFIERYTINISISKYRLIENKK